MIAIFKHKRLHVGFRAKDWADVWMEPVGDIDDEGEADFGLFRFTTGDKGYREPMRGEVVWHPHFDPKRCEADTKPDRESMQRQFLTDAYLYLSEKDSGKAKELEAKMDQPGFSRWQTWFQHAKKFKNQKMKEKRRRDLARKAGDDNVSDSEDSTYESGEEENGRESHSQMPPPPNPRTKRKAPSNFHSSRPTNPKRSRPEKSASRKTQSTQSHLDLQMSGALGSRDNTRRRGSIADSANGSLDGSFDGSVSRGEDGGSQAYDSRPPEGGANFVISANDMQNIPSSRGSRHRGNSRERSLTPFSQWGRNGNPEDRTVQEDISDENRRRLEAINGNEMSEEEAFQRAREVSMSAPQPDRERDDDAENYLDDQNRRRREEINGDQINEDDAFERARQVSMSIPPERQNGNPIEPKTEGETINDT